MKALFVGVFRSLRGFNYRVWIAGAFVFGPRWSLGVGAASGFIAALVAICVLARARRRRNGQ